MNIVIVQINYIVGDIDGNAQKIIRACIPLNKSKIDVVITSELSLLGYPPRDLLLNASFIKKAQEKLEEIAKKLIHSPPIIIGTAMPNTAPAGKPLFNTAALLSKGKIISQTHKKLIPAYDVFDEERYFESAKDSPVVAVAGESIGISVCEDIWNDKDFWKKRRYANDPIDRLTKKNAQYIINISASPFVLGKQRIREAMLAALAKKYGIPIIYVNQVGGNDDLVFDGRSCVFDGMGKLIARAKAFEEDILPVDLQRKTNRISEDDFTEESEAYRALVLSTRDYVRKCGFGRAVIGLSGGIDSSLTAAIATEALGKENVMGMLMPSRYSSQGSIEDAQIVAANLGIATLLLPIDSLMDAYDATLRDVFDGYPQDVTEENIQARIRGNLLMALSNKFHSMVLSTGNKSELAVGYCTIYGDMSGGLAVIADVPKTMVYKLAAYVNRTGEVIPRSVIQKAPSAELRPRQKDQDALPPYDVLDDILTRFIERHYSVEEVIADGFDRSMTERIYALLERAEFKRKQAPPGIKITDRAFGTGWRMPIAKKV